MPRTPGARSFTHAEVAAALTASKGLVSIAAKALGTSRTTIQNHLKKSPVVREALTDAREATLDVGEMALYQQVLKGEGWAVLFLLKTLGKERGYVERQEITGKDGAPLAVIAARLAEDIGVPTNELLQRASQLLIVGER